MLEEILDATRHRVQQLRPLAADLASAAIAAPAPRSLADALGAPGLQVIAEIKRRSPSAGLLSDRLDPVVQAKRYQAGGAAAISVLTEPDFFAGSVADLTGVAESVDVPVLRKDFILDELQLFEARAAGADAVLLIVAALSASQLVDLLSVAADLGLDALVEAHDAAEVAIANDCRATIVGVNNRDLRTFHTDLAVAESLAPQVQAQVRVAESGVSSPAGAARMAAAGYDAILVGESLVTADDPAELVAALKAAASG